MSWATLTTVASPVSRAQALRACARSLGAPDGGALPRLAAGLNDLLAADGPLQAVGLSVSPVRLGALYRCARGWARRARWAFPALVRESVRRIWVAASARMCVRADCAVPSASSSSCSSGAIG